MSVAVVGVAGVGTASAAPVDPYVYKSVRVPAATSVAITSDSSTVLVGSTNSNLYFLDSATRTITTTLNVSHGITDLAISPDGEVAYLVSSADDLVVVVNMFTRTVSRVIDLTGLSPNQIAVTPDGTGLYLTEDSYINTGYPDYLCTGRILAIDLANSDIVTALTFENTCGYGTDIVIAPDGSRVYAAFNNGNMKVVDADRSSTTYNQGTNSGFGSTKYLLITSDGSTLWGSDEYGTVLWCSIPREDSCPDYDSMSSYGTPGPLAISPDAKTLYSGNTEGDVEFFDLDTLESIDRYEVANDDVVAIAAAANGVFLASANFYDNTVTFLGGVTKPSQPRELKVTPGNQSVSVAFTAGSDGGSPITKYQYRLGNGAWTDAVGTTSPITISGLTNYTDYRVQLRAVNAVGASPASKTLAARPRATGPVLNRVDVNSTSSITANFSGSLLGGVNGYRYTVSVVESGTTNSAGTCRTKASGRSCTINGLNAYTDYDVTVAYWFNFPSDPLARTTLPSNTITVRTAANP